MLRLDKNALAYFNPGNGTKVRFAIGKYNKAKRPELVDIKITDYCPFGCKFCYQDSTLEGEHATYDNMRYIAKELGHARVFEVALGGGEPTNHPDFIKICREFRKCNVVPNFTTKSLGWPKRHWDDIKDIIGAFAFSAETVQDLENANKMFAAIPHNRINIHYVMGLQPLDKFVEFLRAARRLDFRVTLLGYKTVGRGNNVKPHNYCYWVDAVRCLVRRGECPTLSIDTPLAAEYSKQLPTDKRSFHTREGFVSLYIDAVAMRMSASSFHHESMLPFDARWVANYKRIEPI